MVIFGGAGILPAEAVPALYNLAKADLLARAAFWASRTVRCQTIVNTKLSDDIRNYAGSEIDSKLWIGSKANLLRRGDFQARTSRCAEIYAL
jgi:hypothetical protein